MRACARGAGERRGTDARLLRAQRQRHRAGRPVERRELADERARGRGAVEHVSGPGGTTTIRRPADDRRVARAAVDLLRDLPELVLERAVQDGRGRRDVGAEERDVEALEPAPRAEAVALALRRVDRRLPVRLDPERGRADREALPGGREDDRPLGEARGAALEQPRGRPSPRGRRRRRRRSRTPFAIFVGEPANTSPSTIEAATSATARKTRRRSIPAMVAGPGKG